MKTKKSICTLNFADHKIVWLVEIVKYLKVDFYKLYLICGENVSKVI